MVFYVCKQPFHYDGKADYVRTDRLSCYRLGGYRADLPLQRCVATRDQHLHHDDTAAMQIKLDELIRAIEGAHNALVDIEEPGEKDLSRFRKRYETLAEEARTALRSGDSDTDSSLRRRSLREERSAAKQLGPR